MSLHADAPRRRLAAVAALFAFASLGAACGSDEAAKPELPEGGTGSIYNDTIIASDSHDEVLLGGGTGEMLVAVQCESDAGGTLVTVVSEGLAPGVYTGVFEPATGVDVVIETAATGLSTGAAQMTLDAEEYTVTFADVEGAEFTLRGCPS